MNKKIGALIITYNPVIEQLRKNIYVARKQVSTCLIVDNGSENIKQIDENMEPLGVKIIHLRENRGIAAAQNEGFKYFKKTNIEWVLTLDQDSLIPEDTIKKYIETGKLSDNQTAIITGTYYDRHWTKTQRDSIMGKSPEKISEKEFVISSNNLVNVTAWASVFGFDEHLFIDMVDYDFDAKLILSGYKIWQVNDVVLDHAVGEVVHRPVLEKILLLPESGLLADHPAFRQYYIYRNTIIFSKRYPQLYGRKFVSLRCFFATRRMFIYKNSVSKIKSAWKGIFDGIKYDVNNDQKFMEMKKNKFIK